MKLSVTCSVWLLLYAALGRAVSDAPEILRISPTSGPEGARVQIVGRNLQQTSAVLFGATSSAFKLISSEKLIAIVPHRTATSTITVVTPLDQNLGATPADAMWKTGMWLDVPRPPKFENIHLLIGDEDEAEALSDVFPIEYWIQAYESHRYEVRIFAFSEYFEIAKEAARNACKRVIGIKNDSFYGAAQKRRG